MKPVGTQFNPEVTDCEVQTQFLVPDLSLRYARLITTQGSSRLPPMCSRLPVPIPLLAQYLH
jgi:hypothetical protein